VQALALLEEGVSVSRIIEYTGLSKATIYRIRKIAIERGYDPKINREFKDDYFTDAPRSGRPKIITEDTTSKVTEVVRTNREGREMTAREIGFKVGISEMSVLRVLNLNGFGKFKPTWKPGLTAAMREARLKFALEHQYWTLEDWKNVIWSDETSIMLGHRRGATRVWRTKEERYDETVIRTRWKKASEFMFWGCFSYDKKGPMHIWTPETAQEKKIAAQELETLNTLREPELKAEWEVNTAMRRMNLRRQTPGKKPEWKFTEKNGKLVRNAKAGGIDWYRYGKVILIGKLIPFAQECVKDRLRTLVQEDNAPAHAHQSQAEIYNLFNI
jgi:transposase